MQTLNHVLWIRRTAGFGQDDGRHADRAASRPPLVHADTQTWAHRDRALREELWVS
jgi:hypothetical protein